VIGVPSATPGQGASQEHYSLGGYSKFPGHKN